LNRQDWATCRRECFAKLRSTITEPQSRISALAGQLDFRSEKCLVITVNPIVFSERFYLEENQMAKPVSISLHKFTSSVQSAVKAAAEKHPKFRHVPVPSEVTFGNLIWGFPVPDGVLAQATLGELQSFVTDVATQIGQGGAEGLAAALPAPKGGFVSFGQVIHCGIPPWIEFPAVKA
jgi:hypothetical protein